MNEEEIKKMIADDFDNFINERLDGAIIFKYISNLEKENLKLKEQLQQKEDIINKANKKIDNMFDVGDGNKVIDDLLELQKILNNKGE